MKTLTLSQRRILWRSLNCFDVLDTTVKEKENFSKLTYSEIPFSEMSNMWNKCAKKLQSCPNADDFYAKVQRKTPSQMNRWLIRSFILHKYDRYDREILPPNS